MASSEATPYHFLGSEIGSRLAILAGSSGETCRAGRHQKPCSVKNSNESCGTYGQLGVQITLSEGEALENRMKRMSSSSSHCQPGGRQELMYSLPTSHFYNSKICYTKQGPEEARDLPRQLGLRDCFCAASRSLRQQTAQPTPLQGKLRRQRLHTARTWRPVRKAHTSQNPAFSWNSSIGLTGGWKAGANCFSC